MENVFNQDLLICECASVEHQLIIRYFKEDTEDDVYVEVHLAKVPFLKRLAYAIKYLFGHQSRYGAFAEFIMNANHVEPLTKVIDHIKMVEDNKAAKIVSGE